MRRRITGELLGGLVVAIATAALATFGGCSRPADAATEERGMDKRLRRVEVEPVSTAEVTERRVYTGGLEASARVALYPLLSERITAFPVEEGTEVRAGQTVALIRAAGLRQSRAQMRAQIEGIDETLASQTRELERARGLHETRVVTRQSLDQLESGYRASLSQRKALEAGLGQISVTAGNAVIRAPFDGVITDKRAETGDIASPQLPLCAVAQVDPIRLDIAVVERDLAVIRHGMRVEVAVDAHPGRIFVGEVAKILPVLDPGTRTNEVRIEIPNPVDEATGERPLKPGMFGRADIIVDTRPGALIVPTRALMVDPEGREGVRRVLVLDDGGVARERLVELGTSSGEAWEITNGLVAGERVVVRGQHGVEDGERVEAQDLSAKVAPASPTVPR
jgi:RND family efflux transporter MFP subunit